VIAAFALAIGRDVGCKRCRNFSSALGRSADVAGAPTTVGAGHEVSDVFAASGSRLQASNFWLRIRSALNLV